MRLFRFLTLSSCLLIAACSYGPVNTNSLSGLKSMHASGLSDNSNTALRNKALEDTALSVGAQAGLAWRADQINDILQSQSKKLDAIFNFNRLMLPDHVLPPVLEMSEKNMKLDGMDTIRLSDQVYIIQAQARFVTVPPNWRDYLIMSYKAPDLPPDNMLPKTHAEQKIWQEYVSQGWQQGIEQANIILHDNLARLTRDVKGMILYRTLLLQQMVSMPFVKQSNLGVTGGGDSLRINDQVLQITALPQLQIDTRKWQPIAVPATTTPNTPSDAGIANG